MSRKNLVTSILMLLMSPLLLASSCDEGDTIINSVLENPPNEPPTIVAQGPEYPTGGFEVITGDVPHLWVIVGDPNGLDDIGAVLIAVDTVIVSRLRLRPDLEAAAPLTCATPSYVANDTIAIPGLLPGGLPGLQGRPISMVQRGLYVEGQFGYSFFSPYGGTFPRIEDLSDAFGFHVKNCAYGVGAELGHFGVYPPAVPSPIEAFVTLADIVYKGVTITAYDKEGEMAVASFPDLRIRYSTEQEMEAAP